MSTLTQRQGLLPDLLTQARRELGVPGRLRLGTNWSAHQRPGGSPFRAIQVHWSATPSASPGNPMPTAGVVRNGWGGLPGPLYNLLNGQNGDTLLVSVGRCNHSGVGSSAALNVAAANHRRLPWGHRPPRGDITVNPHAWSVSADHSGTGQMPPAQRLAMVACLVAICRLEGWSENRIYHHASSTSRKVDVRGWPDLVVLTGNALRSSSPTPAPTPTPEPEPKNIAALEEYAMKHGQSDSKDFDGVRVIEDWQHFCNRFLFETSSMVKTHAGTRHIEAMDNLGGGTWNKDGIKGSNLRADGVFGNQTQSASWQVIVRTGHINGFSVPGRASSYYQNQITPTVQAAAWAALNKYRNEQ